MANTADVSGQKPADIIRIESLIAWNQALTETDKVTYRDYLLVEWNLAQERLAAAKEEEMTRRKAVVAFAFDPNKKSGTERIALGNGYEAKAVKKLNYGFVKTPQGKLDKAAVDAALTAIEQSHKHGAYIAENLVRWQPELSLTEYKKLDESEELKPLKAIIDKVIVTTDGAPTLEIIEPKGKK
ncbi:MAG TPA: hypothetical protein VHK27_07055 [Gammaproteobacteria bacterium]|nr:hypothetical protein [Gammaproteobacteria bacterium]